VVAARAERCTVRIVIKSGIRALQIGLAKNGLERGHPILVDAARGGSLA
jgi:hypothetical protein